MSNLTHLYKVGKTYYYRARIPSDLLPYFQGRKEIRRSLRTRNRSHAAPLVRAWGHRLENVFFKMRYGMLTDDKIHQLATDILEQLLNEDFADRINRPPLKPEEWEFYDHHGHYLEDQADEIEGTLDKHPAYYSPSVRKEIESTVDSILANEHLDLDKSSKDYHKVYQVIGRVIAKSYRVKAERDMKGFTEFDRYLSSPVVSSPAPATVAKPAGPKLTEVIEKHIKAKLTEKTAKQSSIDEYQRAYDLFLKYKGNQSIDSYTRDDLRGFLEILQKLPTKQHMTKFKGKSLQEIAALDHGLKTYAPKTIDDKYFMPIKSLFKWCSSEGYIEKNIAENLSFNYDKVRADQQRDAFSKEDLEGMIKGLAIVKEKELHKNPEHFWIPLLGLFTGARINEICQLFTEDIKQDTDSGIWYMSIKQDAEKGQDVKNKNSIRDIPIHPTLIELGFLDHVDQMRKLKHERLWINLTLDKRGRYSRNFANWFNGQTRLEGFRKKYMTTDKKKVFHSFRHNFATELKYKGVDILIIEELEGRVNTVGQSGRYGKRYPLEILLEALKKADYGLDFSSLM